MRILLSGLVAASLLASHVAEAQCARPTDHAAFDVTGLKSQLMVTALTCGADTRYNEFVLKYRPDLVSTDRSLNSYFSRVYGGNAAKRRDDYVTQLANNQSQTGLRQGSLFCGRNMSIFDEVMALRNGAELADFAAAKALSQPVAINACAPGAPERAATTRSTSRSSGTRHRS